MSRQNTMENHNPIDWKAAVAVLSTLPQDQHAAYLAALSSSREEIKGNLATTTAKGKRVKKVSLTKRNRPTFTHNGVKLTEKQWQAFTCAVNLLRSRDETVKATGVDGFNFLSAKTMLMHMGQRPSKSACDSMACTLRQLKDKGLLDWEAENVERGPWKVKANFRLGPAA